MVSNSLAFSIDAISRSLSLTNANTFTATTSNILTATSTPNGYDVTAYQTQQLTHQNLVITIPDWTGTSGSPTVWTATCSGGSECGWGYNTNDADIGFGANYAAFAPVGDAPGDVVASAASDVSADVTTITYRTSASLIQEAGNYLTTIIYILTPTF